jgi:hypothetical protein
MMVGVNLVYQANACLPENTLKQQLFLCFY